MENYGVVRTDRMHGTDNRADVISVKYYGSGSTPTNIENGNVVKLGDLLDYEIYKGVTPAATDSLDDVVLIATPEFLPNPLKSNLDDFINLAGMPARGYRFKKGSVFSVTKPALDGAETPAVGNIVELKAGTKLNVVASLTSGSTKVGEIKKIDTTKRYTYYVIEVM